MSLEIEGGGGERSKWTYAFGNHDEGRVETKLKKETIRGKWMISCAENYTKRTMRKKIVEENSVEENSVEVKPYCVKKRKLRGKWKITFPTSFTFSYKNKFKLNNKFKFKKLN